MNKMKKDGKTLLLSAVSAVLLLISCYAIDNMPYSFTGGATTGQRIEQIKQLIKLTEDTIPSDLLLINIAYDRDLVPIKDEFGFPKGNLDITDRSKLIKLLNDLYRSDYRYIILDVALTKGFNTPVDSCLTELISKMGNIVIAKSEQTELLDSSLYRKARYSDYSVHIEESNFVKYEFIRHGEPTLPYQVYSDLSCKRITSLYGLYFFNGRLANRSVVLRLPIKLWNKLNTNQRDRISATYRYYNLGSDIIDLGVDIPSLADKKIVVIGDFTENDLHDTYLGKIAGPVINLNAYYALVNDNLSIPNGEIIFLFILYTAISFCIFKGVNPLNTLSFFRKTDSKNIPFITSFISLSTILTLLAILTYLLFGLDMNILIPTIYFTLLITAEKYKKHH